LRTRIVLGHDHSLGPEPNNDQARRETSGDKTGKVPNIAAPGAAALASTRTS
jgi:hypothetical protein